jgi:hypothetical protein
MKVFHGEVKQVGLAWSADVRWRLNPGNGSFKASNRIGPVAEVNVQQGRIVPWETMIASS